MSPAVLRRGPSATAAEPLWCWFEARGFGRGIVVCRGERVVRVHLPGAAEEELQSDSIPGLATNKGFAADVARRLAQCYVTGADVRDIPFELGNIPPFRRQVLEACHRIPHGDRWSYARLAEEAGNPAAVRAAGTSMATNRIALIIPCHRVIKSDGSIGNYGAGIAMKQRLLDLEAHK